MHKPNKNKMAGVNSHFASISESEILKIQEDAVPENTKKAGLAAGLSAIQPSTSTDIQIHVVQENIQFSMQSCQHGMISGGSFANCFFNFHFK